tara:strand:- start:606 stop:863 length:258 start_codon:yes stop_codon:yes gene_type:complete
MKFRSGKYAGQDVAHVRQIAPWYINWVKINRPEMLVERKAKKPTKVVNSYKPSVITPNLNWENEGPYYLETPPEPPVGVFWDDIV